MEVKKQLINELLEIAKKDIEASSLLYKQKLYAQSYFYFQQATEKATKAYFLFLDLIDGKKVFDVRHDLFKLHRKILIESQQNNTNALMLLDVFPFFQISGSFEKRTIKDHIKSAQEGMSFFDSLKQIDLINIPAKDIQLFLINTESLKIKKLKMPVDFEEKVAFF